MIKKLFLKYKEGIEKKRVLNNIQGEAYYKEMQKQAESMGRKQAKLEAKHRERLFSKKLSMDMKKTFSKENNNIDVFGFNRMNEEINCPNVLR